MDSYQQFIALSRYARYLPEQKRRETWDETVARYCDFMVENYPIFPRDEMYDAIVNLNVMPSMRAMMTAGPAAARDNVSMFNCSFTAIDDMRCFDEAMYVLMCGCGIGFSVERQFIAHLPEVAEQFHQSNTTIVVDDSRIGWAHALRELISLLYAGHIPSWDLSQLRPAGAPLKIFGGRSSGPLPLDELFKFCVDIFKKAAGRKLNSRECHDLMCKIGDVVVVGGVRRSALLSLSNLSDQRMALAKSGEWWKIDPHRALANNSVAYTEKPEMRSFINEWLNLYESKSGERGIYNRYGAIKKIHRIGRRNPDFHFGTNPCQPALAPILTPNGLSTMGVIKEGNLIWSEDGWVTVIKKWSTGIKPVYCYRTTAGIFYGTAEHRVVENGIKIQVAEAEGIDVLVGNPSDVKWNSQAIIDGLMIGDGAKHKASFDDVYLNIGSNDQDYFTSEVGHLIVDRHGASDIGYKVITEVVLDELPHLPERCIPQRYVLGSLDIVASFLRGLYSANGSIVSADKQFRVTLKTTNIVLVEQVQMMLSALGILSYYTTNKPTKIKWANGIYTSRESYDINIPSRFGNTFAEKIGFIQKYKTEKLHHKRLEYEQDMKNLIESGKPYRKPKVNYEIKSVELLGEMEVFDINVSGDHHTYWSGCHNVSNCAEIILRSSETCNLSEVVIREDDTIETLREKVTIATILGTFQACFTDFRYLRSVWKKNVDEERLLGVSLTGIMDHPLMSGRMGLEPLAKILEELKQVAIDTNKEWADRLGIPQSAAITCCKPSGTVSQLVDASSGIHPRFNHYYIRTVRNDKKDPLSTFLIEQGVPHETDVTKDSNWVFSFPVKSPSHSRIASEMTAIDQLEHYLIYTRHWAEHSCSITVYVREHEWLDVAAWVYRNFDDLNGVSFLPYSEHIYKQAPYTSISEAAYLSLAEAFPAVDYSEYKVDEYEDHTKGSNMLACSAGVCEL